MKITYFGHACFLIESEDGIKILTDPYTQVGYELPDGITADVVLVSHGHFDHNYLAAVDGNPLVIDRAGKFEAFGIHITGENSWHDPEFGALRGANVVFSMKVDGMRICHFGDLGEDVSKISEKEGFNADIWLIPVGGKYTIDSAQAWAYIRQFKPKAVIPMHYRPEDGALDITDASAFLQQANKEHLSKYPNGQCKLSASSWQEGETKIIYMERYKP